MLLAERWKYQAHMQPRSLLAARAARSRLLDELVAVIRMLRKHLIRLRRSPNLACRPPATLPGRS